MNSLFILYNQDMSGKFTDKEILNYLETLKHSDDCTNKFDRRDKVVGEVYLKSNNQDYIIYYCNRCGGRYYAEGTATSLYIRNGCESNCL